MNSPSLSPVPSLRWSSSGLNEPAFLTYTPIHPICDTLRQHQPQATLVHLNDCRLNVFALRIHYKWKLQVLRLMVQYNKTIYNISEI